MCPSRVPNSKNFRFNRYVRGVGQISNSARTSKLSEFRRRDGILTKLIEGGHLEILRLFKAGTLTIEELVDADRHERLTQVAEGLRLQRLLEEAVDGWLPQSAEAVASRKRYGVSWRAFLRVAYATKQLRPGARVGDLARMDFRRLRNQWGASGADFNRARAMLSAFLSTYLGDTWHPFRRKVMKGFPRGRESAGDMPQATSADFWAIVENAPDHVKASYVSMAVLGAYPKEYLSVRPEDVHHDQQTVTINGTKNEHRHRIVAVDPRFWEWIERGIPSKVQHGWLRIHWKRACAAAGIEGLQLKHLRHLSAQWAGDRGVTDRDLTTHLGHTNPSMSHRYARRAISRGIATAIADELVAGRVA